MWEQWKGRKNIMAYLLPSSGKKKLCSEMHSRSSPEELHSANGGCSHEIIVVGWNGCFWSSTIISPGVPQTPPHHRCDNKQLSLSFLFCYSTMSMPFHCLVCLLSLFPIKYLMKQSSVFLSWGNTFAFKCKLRGLLGDLLDHRCDTCFFLSRSGSNGPG